MTILVGKLLREETFDVQTLTEGSDPLSQSRYIVGPFLVAEELNKNKRRYPRHILEREVNSFQKLIQEARAASCGEYGHPDTPSLNLDRISHRIMALEWDGNHVMGKAKILEDQACGKAAAGLLKEGIKLGVSSRGVGSLKLVEGYNLVQDDYKMSTIDIVSDPSGPGCFVNGIMENAQWVLDAASGNWKLIEETQKMVRRASRKELEGVILEAFNHFMRKL